MFQSFFLQVYIPVHNSLDHTDDERLEQFAPLGGDRVNDCDSMLLQPVVALGAFPTSNSV
jgi:hypothetical protein